MTATPPAALDLDRIEIASPCSASWDAMEGSDQVRFCGQCQLNVYDLSALSRPEAEQVVQEQEGRLCVRFRRRADGTLLTQNCPVGFARLRRRWAMLKSAVAACVGFFLSGTLSGCTDEPDYAMGGPRAIPALPAVMGDPAPVDPVQLEEWEMGDVVAPAPDEVGALEQRIYELGQPALCEPEAAPRRLPLAGEAAVASEQAPAR